MVGSDMGLLSGPCLWRARCLESDIRRPGALTCHTTCPPYVVMPASDRSEHPTRRSNDLWQTDFAYLRVVGWGWYESAAEQPLQRERQRSGAHVVERIAIGQAGVLRVKRALRALTARLPKPPHLLM